MLFGIPINVLANGTKVSPVTSYLYGGIFNANFGTMRGYATTGRMFAIIATDIA